MTFTLLFRLFLLVMAIFVFPFTVARSGDSWTTLPGFAFVITMFWRYPTLSPILSALQTRRTRDALLGIARLIILPTAMVLLLLAVSFYAGFALGPYLPS